MKTLLGQAAAVRLLLLVHRLVSIFTNDHCFRKEARTHHKLRLIKALTKDSREMNIHVPRVRTFG